MIRASHVSYPSLQLDYGWMFDIQSSTDLMDWFETVRTPQSAIEFADALHCTELGGSGSHAKEGAWLASLASIRGDSLVQNLAKLNADTLTGMLTVLRDSGRLFINGRGGYFQASKHIKILKTVKLKDWILPGKRQIKISKWPGGTHYYAKVGTTSVEIDGQQKWATEYQAELAAKEFKMRYKL